MIATKQNKTMPKKLDNCVRAVIKQGKNESSAYAICVSQLQKTGVLKKGKQKK